MSVADIKKAIEEGKAVFGYKIVMTALKNKELKEVFLAGNCPASYERDIKHACSFTNTPVTIMKQANDELGVICKKPFSISVLGIQ